MSALQQSHRLYLQEAYGDRGHDVFPPVTDWTTAYLKGKA